jgi:hypothetical protein
MGNLTMLENIKTHGRHVRVNGRLRGQEFPRSRGQIAIEHVRDSESNIALQIDSSLTFHKKSTA